MQRGGDVQRAAAEQAGQQRGARGALRERVAQRGLRQVGAGGGEQRQRAGDERGGHRGALAQLEAAAAGGREDRAAGRGEVDGAQAAVGDRDERAGLLGRGRDEHRGLGRRRRVGRREVDVAGVVAGGGDDRRALRAGVPQRGVEVAARAVAVDRDVEDLRAAVDRVDDALGQARGVAGAVGVEHLDGHDLRARGDARAADAVAGLGGDDAGDVRAVAVVVLDVAVELLDVRAVDVVDVAVAVVVDVVGGRSRSALRQRLFARSGWLSCTPLSRIATRTPAPCDCVQASGAPVAACSSPHCWPSSGSGAAVRGGGGDTEGEGGHDGGDGACRAGQHTTPVGRWRPA